MLFNAEICKEPPENPLILGHFLPWFTRDSQAKDYSLSTGLDKGILVPDMEPWRHWRDNRSVYKRTHLYQPLWGEYDSRDKDLIRTQISIAVKYGLDGFIVNLYGKNSVENYIGLFFLECLEEYNAANPEKPFLFCISFDAQAQWNTEGKTPVTIEDDFEYLKNTWMRSPAYITREGQPVMLVFPYERGCMEYRRAADEVFGQNILDIVWGGVGAGGQTAAYPWVRPDKEESNGLWLNPDESGKNYLTEFYKNCNKDESLKYIIGGVWPGFNDQLVRWAWNGKSDESLRPRVICRESTEGSTLELTWSAAIEYLTACSRKDESAKLEMPAIQLITWNDWAEATNIEPDKDFGFKALEICKMNIDLIKCHGGSNK